MNSNVIAFDRNRQPNAQSAAIRAARGFRDNVVSIDDWKTRPRARRTASGVFFTTAVLLTTGSLA